MNTSRTIAETDEYLIQRGVKGKKMIIVEGDGNPRHGTINGYNNYKCRCPMCKQAWADYMRDLNHRRGRHQPMEQYLQELRDRPLPAHGTESRYIKYKCRCNECRYAAMVARAARKGRPTDTPDR